ncbi:MAG: tetratricopeptide repeat protein [Magnetococcales bacterium]|nr:tetratricopeptide repeat protein [Magnetococcales bacterium]
MNDTPSALTLPQALSLGMEHHQSGQLDQAERIYQQILAAFPNQPDALHLLGAIAHQKGDFRLAEQRFRQTLIHAPNHRDALNNLGNALRDQGRLDEAIEAFHNALSHYDDFSEVYNNLGDTLRLAGRIDEAISHTRRAISINSNFPLAHNNLGNLLKSKGKTREAEHSYRYALKLAPEYAEALANLGHTLLELGQETDALDILIQAATLRPDLTPVQNTIGNLLLNQKRYQEAEAHYRCAIQTQPDLAEAYHNLSIALEGQQHLPQALEILQQATTRFPNYANAHFQRGNIHRRMGQLDDALMAYDRALSLDTDHPGYLNNHANTLRDLGRLHEALEGYRRAFACGGEPPTLKNFANTHLYLPETDHDTLFNICRKSAKMALSRTRSRAAPSAPSIRPPQGRIRVGYLSSDFHDHPVGHNLLPLLEHHDNERFERFAYAELPQEDATTERIRSTIQHWRNTKGCSDAEIAETIRQDGVDIMIYLAGMFDNNRFLVAAQRPAPIQVSFHNSTTTGLKQMDYWLTDHAIHPEGAVHEQFTEQLIRLPIFYNYPPLEQAPPVNPLPAGEKGPITFASFNDPAKINHTVLALWARLLQRIPDARLLLKYRSHLHVPSIRTRLLKGLEKGGVDSKRVTLITTLDQHQDHLSTYHQADIALDPFPFTGATTTFQALWMGVPVVTWAGTRFISRMAADIVIHAGYPELATRSPEAYLDAAVALASDRPRLQQIRAELRHRLKKGPLCDGPGYARSVEAAYRNMLDSKRRVLTPSKSAC